jgi:hypothetical protein
MELSIIESPIISRQKVRVPNYCLLTRARIITEEDIGSNKKWKTLRAWYDQAENSPNTHWIDQALQSMVNAIVYQERIYFAITRETLKELFQNDTNWKNKISLSPSYYGFLISEMVNSGFFEAHPNNKRFKKQRKPMVFKVVDKRILNLLKAPCEKEQEQQVLNFVENYDKNEESNIVVNNVVNNVVNTESQKVRESESQVEMEMTCKNNVESKDKITLEQLLWKELPDNLPRYEELKDLAKKAIVNCEDFNIGSQDVRIFTKHLVNLKGGKLTVKQKDHIDGIVQRFKIEAEKYIALQKLDNMNFQIKEPKELESKIIKKAIDDSDKVQSDTVKILNATFGKETIRVLRNKLEKTNDPNKRLKIEKEIQFWESTM